ncbi:MAG TPA: hypothetical protein VGU01_14795 [Sphingomicrobium sp.]|nr:hypothetical protein [Sphingomicrobium sp.]
MRNFAWMDAIDLKFGIPNIELGCASGEMVNPSSFAGHELVVLFCPLDPGAAFEEIAKFLAHSAEFVERDAWLLTIAERGGDLAVDGAGRALKTIPDPGRHAWVAFRELTPHDEVMDRESGATFLFTRGGNLHRYWQGSGHVDDVLAELKNPLS